LSPYHDLTGTIGQAVEFCHRRFGIAIERQSG
jgi:hypothetical protein